jgi:hypothetical protein
VAYVNDGTGADLDVTNSSYTLAVNWAKSTSSAITRYWYSCGYTPGEDDAISWKTVGLSTSVIRTNLTLVDGVTYYFNVKAENSDGLQSAVTSADGICALLKSTLDTTAPAAAATVNDGTGTDVDVTASSTSLSANWPAATDAQSGIAEYWYCIGTTAGGATIVSWTSAGAVTAVTRTGLSLTNGATYYVSVKAENGVGLQSSVRSSDGIYVKLAAAVDTTAPAAVTAVNDGTGTDTDVTASSTALSANWPASSDAESGITEYWYSIGTSAGGTNILNWASAGTATAITRTGLSLMSGTTYYISVKAENGAGLQSAVRSSDGVCVRLNASSPVIACVNDGFGADEDMVTSQTTLAANWAASADSGFVIAAYWYSLGYTPGADDAISWKTVNLSTYVIRTNLTLVDGVTYYFNIRAVNAAGTQSAVTSSDGICARLGDTSTPSTGAPAAVAYVNDGFGADVDITTSEAILAANWGTVSGAAKYWYSMGYTPGADDAISWKTVNLSTCVVRTNLVLKNGVLYYFNVRVENAAGVQSAVTSSDGVRAVLSDTTAPSTVATVNDGGTTDSDVTTSNTTLSATWTASTDAESGIAAYWYSIGTAAGGTSVVGWTSVGTETSMARTGLSLMRGTTYYISVKAENGIGLQSAARSSDGLCVIPNDTTAPAAVASVNDGTGTDLDVTASLTTISVNWTASSDAESGIAEYWYSIGTTPGGTDTAGWASAGTATTVTRTGLSLTNGTAYYVSVKAENGAGLQSAAASSDGITVDAGDTSAPAVPEEPEEIDGCIGRWKFDEGSGTLAADSSGKGRKGTLYNGTQWVTGKSGKAVKFDGSNDYIQIANADTLANVTDFTVDFWVNPSVWKTKENLAYNGLFKIYHRGDWAGDCVYFMVKINSTQASGDSSWGGWAAVRSVQELEAGTWSHLTCVKSGNNLVLYINGVKDREIAALSGFSVSKAKLTDLAIGGYATFFNGSIDDFRICSTALSGAAAYSVISKEYTAAKTAGFAAADGGVVADAYGNRIIVPAGAVAGSGQFVTVMTSPDRSDSVIETADSCLSKQFAVITSQDLCREILAQVNGVAVTQFSTPVTMVFAYKDADNDGIVDGTTFRETRLVVARLDDVKNEWVALPTSVDAVANTASVTTDRLKIFTILGVQGAGTIDDAVCYPNPCRLPQDGHVRISGIPNDSTEATVYIYTLTGTLVKTLREGAGITVTATDKQGVWDGTNDHGSKIASGLYLCLIKTGTGKKTEKIGIIR